MKFWSASARAPNRHILAARGHICIPASLSFFFYPFSCESALKICFKTEQFVPNFPITGFINRTFQCATNRVGVLFRPSYSMRLCVNRNQCDHHHSASHVHFHAIPSLRPGIGINTTPKGRIANQTKAKAKKKGLGKPFHQISSYRITPSTGRLGRGPRGKPVCNM